jgi:hypothetical protein
MEIVLGAIIMLAGILVGAAIKTTNQKDDYGT